MTPPTAALPCPFCAEDMILFKKVSPGTAGYFMCADCGGHTGTCINETEALIQWNRRAPAVQATADADGAAREIEAWKETAAQGFRNSDFYRGLVVQIGEMFGDAAYISDDGSRRQDVLALKVPGLVAAALGKAVSPKAAAEIPLAELLALRAELVQYANDAYCTGISIARTTPCLGWEAKAKCGEYGKAEHDAHAAHQNWDGIHRGAWECIRHLDAVLESPAAVSGDKQEKERE